MSAPDAKRRAMLAKLHIAKKEMALADETYRAILQRIAAKASASDCTDAQLDTVLAEFKRLGWKPKTKRPRSAVPHVRLVYALWTELRPRLKDGSDAALRSFVHRQTGMDSPEWLDAPQATKVIEGLKAWLARTKKGKAA